MNNSGEQTEETIDEYKMLLQTKLDQYVFQNDHIMRGPLCRAMGLLELLTREKLTPEGQKLLGMLKHEIRDIENVTFLIGKILEDHRESL